MAPPKMDQTLPQRQTQYSNLHQSCNGKENRGQTTKESRVSISQNVVDDPVPIRVPKFDQRFLNALLYFLILKEVSRSLIQQLHAIKALSSLKP